MVPGLETAGSPGLAAWCCPVADGGAHPLATDHASQTHGPHQPRHRAASNVEPFAPQLPPDLADAVDAEVLLERAANLQPERIVTPSPSRPSGRLNPSRYMRMVGGWGDRQNSADHSPFLSGVGASDKPGGVHDAAEVFDTSEEPLDEVALPVEPR